MSQIISVVPNVCEGRDEAFVEKVQEKLEAVPGLVVLDVSMDQVRNRTIFSFTGRKEAVFEGGFLLYEAALGQIDMRKHEGEYPRIGAVDVFPFVALRDAPVATAVDCSVQFAEEVARSQTRMTPRPPSFTLPERKRILYALVTPEMLAAALS